MINLLIASCVKQRTLKEAQILVSKSETQPELAILSTPFGKGRLVRSWKIGGKELVGLIICERVCRDKYDQTYWEPVWALHIPQFEDPFTGTGDGKLTIKLNDSFEDDQWHGVFSAIMSMTYGLIEGPVLE
ncbi:hypothetical protein [Janthinobacterium sp. J1-1]|uniref:hypothetical protein n=1 Tax=Janthinobacterium sp. J1-1 TaxID=3065910 RepID=UPI002810AD0A|nr:hypothetical protein [Janthinobacterium sp. J1-1]